MLGEICPHEGWLCIFQSYIHPEVQEEKEETKTSWLDEENTIIDKYIFEALTSWKLDFYGG